VTDGIATLMVAVVVEVVGLGQSSFPALSQETGDRPPVGIDRTAVAPPREPNVTPSHDEIAVLLKRGQELMRNGDIAAARLVLRRAAEAKSAEAALTLGATYDPVILRELRVYGFSADIGMARTWYEKAKELGSPEAARRLDILAR
jgi:TPR repeat protein